MRTHEYIGSIPHTLWGNNGEPKGIWGAMPDADLANLGKGRECGVAWICGDYAEVCIVSTTFLTGVAVPQEKHHHESLTPEEISQRVSSRAKKTVRRLCNTNRFYLMWTLTFCPGNSSLAAEYEEPCCNLTQAHYHSVRSLWKRFLRRLKKHDPNVRWLVIFEQHDSNETSEVKRGTYHLHFATDTFLEWKTVMGLWKHGNVRFDNFRKNNRRRKGGVRNPGAYLSKYIGKDFQAGDEYQKRYTCSRNILRPAKVSLDTFDKMYPGEKTVVYESHKEFPFCNDHCKTEGIYGISQTTYKLS